MRRSAIGKAAANFDRVVEKILNRPLSSEEIERLKGCASHLVRILQAVRMRDVAARVEEARRWFGSVPQQRPRRIPPPNQETG